MAVVARVLERRRLYVLLAAAVAVVLGFIGVTAPRGNVSGVGGGGLMCGYFVDPATGITQVMTGRFFVGRERWLGEPVADVADVTLVSSPVNVENPSILLKTDCIDIARQAMLRDASSVELPDPAALIEASLTSPTGATKRVYWWRYPLAVVRYCSAGVLLLGCAGVETFFRLEGRRRRRLALESGVLCAHCGYQLAGLPAPAAAQMVCPECGKGHDLEQQHGEPAHPLMENVVLLVRCFLVALAVLALGAMSRL